MQKAPRESDVVRPGEGPAEPTELEESAADAALAEYLERTERGEAVDREAFLRAHPDVAAELRAFFDADADFGAMLDSVLPDEDAGYDPPAGLSPRLGQPAAVSPVILAEEEEEPPAAELTQASDQPTSRRWLWSIVAASLVAALVGVLVLSRFRSGELAGSAASNKGPSNAGPATERPKRKFTEGVVWDGKPAVLVRPRPTAPRANKLVGHWDFAQGPHPKLTDLSGFEHAGLVRGGDWQAEEGLGFDGARTTVWLGNPTSLDFEGEITLVARIKLATADGLRNIVAHGHTFQPAAGVFLRIAGGQYQAGSWDGTDHLASTPIPPTDVGQWVHLAGVYDGKSWRLYRQGKLAQERLDAIGSISTPDDWAIGSCGNQRERFFHGQIREVRLYDRALSADEVAELVGQ